MEDYKLKFIECAINSKCLIFGDFTLKSGKKSPYFFNTGNFSTGSSVSVYASAYAEKIAQIIKSNECGKLDALFGPAYKGIPLVTAVAMILSEKHNIDIPFLYDRKEVKDHGEGGKLVGTNEAIFDQIEGDEIRVLILDDVITAGTAIRGSCNLLKESRIGDRSIIPCGIMISFDRCEKMDNGKTSSETVSTELAVPVYSVVTIHDVLVYLENVISKPQSSLCQKQMELHTQENELDTLNNYVDYNCK